MDKQRRQRDALRPCAGSPAPAERAPDRATRLGEILVAQGKITPEQLAIALERQRTSGRRLGEELVKAGFVQRAVVSRALRIQRRIVFGALTTLAATTIAPHGDAATLRGQSAVSAFVPARVVAQNVAAPAAIIPAAADDPPGCADIAPASP